MSRITERFRTLNAEGQTGLITYLPVGYPTLAETPALVRAAIAGGASIVELGVPFSDPLADGVTIQRATNTALEQGTSMTDCIETVRELRAGGVDTPLILMGYYNTYLSYGLDRFCAEASTAGADGLIAVDLPPEEADALLAAARLQGLDLVFFLAPTSTDDRMANVAAIASGFIYCVSLAGVTGARTALPEHLPDFLAQVRKHTPLPLAVGFGIAGKDHVAEVGRIAEAAVVGSALIDMIDRAPAGERAAAVERFVAELAAGTAVSASEQGR